MPIKHFYNQTVADGTATSVVRPSDWNSNHSMVYNLSGNTLGSSQIGGADVVLVGGNNITLSADTAASKLVINGNTNQDFWSLQGNTAGTNVYSWTNDGLYLYGGNNITLSGSGSTITISGAAGGGGAAATRQYFDNLGPLATASGAMGAKQVQNNQLQVFPLKPFADIFNGSMTINTLLIDLSVSGSTATLSAAGISTVVRFGLYTVNSTAATLSAGLVNSFQTTLGLAAAATNNSTYWNGQRFLSVHSSQWSSQPVLSDNVMYVGAIGWQTSGSSAQTFNMLGGYAGSTAARSGFLGQATANATHNGAFGPFLGVYGTTTTALPAGINYTQVNKQSASANFIPHLIGHNFTDLTLM